MARLPAAAALLAALLLAAAPRAAEAQACVAGTNFSASGTAPCTACSSCAAGSAA